MQKGMYFMWNKQLWAKLYVWKVKGEFREQTQSPWNGTFPAYQAASPKKEQGPHLTLWAPRVLTELTLS